MKYLSIMLLFAVAVLSCNVVMASPGSYREVALEKLKTVVKNSADPFEFSPSESTLLYKSNAFEALQQFEETCGTTKKNSMQSESSNFDLKIVNRRNYVVYLLTCQNVESSTELPLHYQFVLDADSTHLLKFSVFNLEPIQMNTKVNRAQCDMKNPGEFLGILVVSTFLTSPVSRSLYPGEGDKWRHMLVGNWAAQSVHWGLRFFFGENGIHSAYAGDLAALTTGIGGEIKDYYSPKTNVVEARDVTASAIGGLINHLTVELCSILKGQK